MKCQLCLSSKFTHVVSPQLKQTMCTLFFSFSLWKVDSSSKCGPPLACRPGVRWCRPRSRAGCRRWSRGSSRSCSPPAPSWSPPHRSRGPAPANIVIMLGNWSYDIQIPHLKVQEEGSPVSISPGVLGQPAKHHTHSGTCILYLFISCFFIYLLLFCKQYDEQYE